MSKGDAPVYAYLLDGKGIRYASMLPRTLQIADQMVAVQDPFEGYKYMTYETLDGDYVLSMIRIPVLQINVLWLRAQEQDQGLFVAIEPVPEGISPGKRYTNESFNREVQTLAESMAFVKASSLRHAALPRSLMLFRK